MFCITVLNIKNEKKLSLLNNSRLTNSTNKRSNVSVVKMKYSVYCIY